VNNVSKVKKFTFIFFFGLTSTVLCGALLEGTLRLGIIKNPQHTRLQIQGKQNRAKYKLLILGDSFILKGGLLGRPLAQHLGSYDITVFNAATSGTGPFEYLAEMRAVGVKFKPDIVLLAYYTGNDLTNVQNHQKFNPNKPSIAINSAASRSYLQKLYLYHYFLQKIRVLLARFYYFDYEEAQAAGISPDLVEDAKQLRINPWLVKLALYEKNYLLDNILMETEENIRAWEKVKDLLAEIHDVCKYLEAQLAIVTFPRSIQINESHFKFYEDLTFNIDKRTLESVKPQRLLMEFCADRRIPCLDLLPAFKARKKEEFYREKDDHLNEKGNRLAEELILDFILQNTTVGS